MLNPENLTRTVRYYRALLSREMEARELRLRVGYSLVEDLRERGVKSLKVGNDRIARRTLSWPMSPTRRRAARKLGSTGVVERLEVHRGT